ncbi:hypothetical protein PS2_016080 [Malus domestica]
MNDERFLQGPSGLDLELVEVPSKGCWGLILKVGLMKNEESLLDLSGFAWKLWSFKASSPSIGPTRLSPIFLRIKKLKSLSRNVALHYPTTDNTPGHSDGYVSTTDSIYTRHSSSACRTEKHSLSQITVTDDQRQRSQRFINSQSKRLIPKSRIPFPFSGKSHGGVFRLAEFDAKKTLQFFHAVVVRRARSGRGAIHNTQAGFGA